MGGTCLQALPFSMQIIETDRQEGALMTLTTKHFGADIPKIGFGTWKLRDETAQMCVAKAIRLATG